MLKGQQMTCQSNISLLTTHIVLTHIIGVIVCSFMRMSCVAKHTWCTESDMAIQKPRSQPHRAHVGCIRQQDKKPSRATSSPTRTRNCIAWGTSHNTIFNASYQQWGNVCRACIALPREAIDWLTRHFHRSKFAEKWSLNHLLKCSLIYVSMLSYLSAKKTWICATYELLQTGVIITKIRIWPNLVNLKTGVAVCIF